MSCMEIEKSLLRIEIESWWIIEACGCLSWKMKCRFEGFRDWLPIDSGIHDDKLRI